MTRDLNVLESPRFVDSRAQTLAFPVEVGKRWRYTSEWLFKPKNSKGTSVVDVAVIGYEKVRVPAGEFDAFRLESKAALRGVAGLGSQIDGVTTRTYYSAPAARAIVKYVIHNLYLGTSTVELVRFELR